MTTTTHIHKHFIACEHEVDAIKVTIVRCLCGHTALYSLDRRLLDSGSPSYLKRFDVDVFQDGNQVCSIIGDMPTEIGVGFGSTTEESLHVLAHNFLKYRCH